MGLKNWLINFLGGAVIVDGDCASGDMQDLAQSVAYKEMAVFTAVDLIARSICKCEIKTYKKGKEVKEALWYQWNVEPNDNESASQFMRRLVYKLYTERECLVIRHKNQLHIADSFMRNEGGIKPDTFDCVTVGDTTFARAFTAKEVMYWNLGQTVNGREIEAVLDMVSEQYANLLTYCIKSYQTSRGNKAIFRYESLPQNVNITVDGAAEKWLKAQAERYSKFISADGGVAPVGKGVNLEPFGVSKTYANENTRDIRAMIDDLSDFVAKAFGIPPALLRGDVQGTSEAMDLFLTTCIDPLVDLLREEIVRKEPTMGIAMLINGNNIVFDTTQVKHVDLLSVGSNVDKLIGSGVCCVNDILKLVGLQPIDEDWASTHFITNNYSTFDKALSQVNETRE